MFKDLSLSVQLILITPREYEETKDVVGGIAYPASTYDLEELLTLCKSMGSSMPDELSFCTWLTPYGAEFRYPGEYPEASHKNGSESF